MDGFQIVVRCASVTVNGTVLCLGVLFESDSTYEWQTRLSLLLWFILFPSITPSVGLRSNGACSVLWNRQGEQISLSAAVSSLSMTPVAASRTRSYDLLALPQIRRHRAPSCHFLAQAVGLYARNTISSPTLQTACTSWCCIIPAGRSLMYGSKGRLTGSARCKST